MSTSFRVVLESCSLSLTPHSGFFVKDSTHVSRLPCVFRISVHSRTFHDQGRYERLRLSRSSSSFIRPSTLVRHITLPGGETCSLTLPSPSDNLILTGGYCLT